MLPNAHGIRLMTKVLPDGELLGKTRFSNQKSAWQNRKPSSQSVTADSRKIHLAFITS
jgi:hypothetical protein